MTETVLTWFMNLLEGLPSELIVFVVSMVPIIELRGGLVAAALLGMPFGRGLLFCLLGNMLPVPFILWLITPIFNWLKKTRLLCGLVEKLERSSLEKSEQIQRYQFWGLVLFVGVPLPGTGAWTGSLIAVLLSIPKKKAIAAIYTGVCLAAAIMSFISYGIPALIRLF